MIMKKLVMGIVAVLTTILLFAACKNKPANNVAKKPVTTPRTLNGIKYSDAMKMISDFQTNDAYKYDIGEKSVTAWLSRSDIQIMRSVLNDEAIKNGVDGVRFYFGAESRNGTELGVKVILITTKLKNPLPNPGDSVSTHGDYPTNDTLLTAELGESHHHKADSISQVGGLLYGDNNPTMPGRCVGRSLHSITGRQTYNWVQRRDDKKDNRPKPIRHCDTSGYNTKSEWFDICFISSLFDAVLNNNNNLDGLRIYLGEAYKPKLFKNRDVFIIVPTHKNGSYHEDVFNCITLTRSSLCKLNEHPAIKPSETELDDKFHKVYFESESSNFMDGGYDKGELCPTICN